MLKKIKQIFSSILITYKRLSLNLGMDRVNPKAERAPKLTGLILRIAYGPCKQKIELDWIGL